MFYKKCTSKIIIGWRIHGMGCLKKGKIFFNYEYFVVLFSNRNRMKNLSAQEEQLMLAIWQVGEGNVKAFMDLMSEQLPYTTVASTIKNLEKKGYVSARLFGNVYVYKPAISEEEYKRKFMGNVVKDYFSNSYKELVNFFVDQKKLSAQELKDIVKLIESGKKK